ncbi:hypothetical protein [Salibacter sp.]|uniref:hypothetical protein n=1 Tax=Salibacter sp. TaxID=2010995 RepID=UPI00286FAF61|nr:hypothetical protein [Salibacter sp.]MDR9399100.1 hypothetical protein [Salibacter sp.]MDR9488123.1 hypothetical protein [Salibacter sp.]
MMKLKNLLPGLLFLSLAFTGCDDEIDITAPQKEVPVVYAIFNQNENTHYVKVNRLLQGDRSFDELAKDRSIAEYEDVKVEIVETTYTSEFNEEVDRQNARYIECTPVEVTNKDSGTFYYPNQKVYQYEEDDTLKMNEDNVYGVRITLPSGEEVTGFTPLVRTTSSTVKPGICRPQNLTGCVVDFGSRSSTTQNEFSAYSIVVTQPGFCRSFETSLTFRYREVIDGQLSDPKDIVVDLGKETFESTYDPRGGQAPASRTVRFVSDRFYQIIADRVPDLDDSPGVEKRILDSAFINVEFASEDLELYTQVSQPSESLLEDKPPFTNLKGGGIGVVGSRNSVEIKLPLSTRTQEELVNATVLGLTAQKGFCNTQEPNNDCYP